jgi:DNA mismatch repair protein MutS
MLDASNLSPMFRQYRTLKHDHPASVLLFRMGDFYEMFYEDAKLASRLLELTLTARGKGTDHVAPMCGFPYHQLDQYIGRLVRANCKVAICEQVEDPRQAKGLVRREVVRLVTPGTVNDPSQLEPKQNHWLAAVAEAAGRLGAAFLDASTGEFLAWESAPGAPRPWDALTDRLRSFAPREIVFPEDLATRDALRQDHAASAAMTPADPCAFSPATARASLERRFGVATLDGFGLREHPAAVAAGGGLLQYVEDAQRCGLEHVDRLLFHEPAEHLILDAATRRNLELERCLRDGAPRGSLFGVLDATLTASGGRLLRRWLLQPLLDLPRIAARHDGVEELVRGPATRERLRARLEGIHDVERLLARIVAATATPRDVLALGASLERLPELVAAAAELRAAVIRESLDGLDPCADLARLVRAGIADDPPASAREAGMIRDGFDAELDGLRAVRRDGRAYLGSLEARERELTGIGSLKVRFNRVFGYFIEVSKPNLHLVPDRYQRKQTIANGERYVTPELKEYEARILQADERIEAREVELFQSLRASLASQAARIKATARATARLDVLAALAEIAVRHDYCRPLVDASPRARIVGGRHPVVEQALVDDRFVANDLQLEAGGAAIAVLTGPNMGGKSTYLRQVALISLMAQAGSFVPAREAELGLVDRIFCRVGASDSLAEGHSTFMVEMTETANILHHATTRSLLLLDEVGRGTATFDGLSIAWAVVEALAATRGGAPRCLFATHYHELTELAAELPQVINLRLAVRESADGVVFLHRVERGAADRSYGLHVARLAGMPAAVVDRAEEILSNLERDEYGRDGLPRRARGRRRPAAPASARQAALFEAAEPAGPDPELYGVLDEIRRVDPDGLTPLEALSRLAAWRRRLRPAPPG